MTTYIIKRLLLMPPMMLAITIVSFLIINLAPGVSGGGAGGGDMTAGGRMTKQQAKIMRKTFHIGEPIYVRYVYWLGAVQPPYEPEELVLRLPFTVSPSAAPGPRTVKARLSFRGSIERMERKAKEADAAKKGETGAAPWDEQGRYAPVEAEFELTFEVKPGEERVFLRPDPRPNYGKLNTPPAASGPFQWSAALEYTEVGQGETGAVLVKLNAGDEHFLLAGGEDAPRLEAVDWPSGVTFETFAPPPVPKRGLLFGDLGQSVNNKSVPVMQKIKEALPITIIINLLAILVIYGASIPIGIHSATHQNTFLDRTTTVGLFILYSLPSFWVAILLIRLMVALKNSGSPHFPLQGLMPPGSEALSTLEYLWQGLLHLFLPVLASCYAGLAGLSRFMRVGMIEIIRSDFVRTARAKGCDEPTVIYRHALRNSLIPIITILAGLLPGMIGGSLIIEQIFGIPGMGYMAYNAMVTRDYTVLMSTLTFGSFLTLIGILMSDIMYVLVDPRISFDKGGR
ncbi:MAG: hypothetical protein AMXMBFR7_35580 [Planctomycetota bacterium]